MTKKKNDNIKNEEEILQEDINTAEDQIENTAESILSREEELENEVQEQKDKYLRLFAEFDNYKKRTNKERLNLISNAAKQTLVAILPVLDDFDRAYAVAESPNNTEPMSEGVLNIYHKLKNIIQHQGVKEMTSTNEVFDPEYHEAITEIPAPTAELKGKVIDTIEKGYFLHDSILRFAKVVVGK